MLLVVTLGAGRNNVGQCIPTTLCNRNYMFLLKNTFKLVLISTAISTAPTPFLQNLLPLRISKGSGKAHLTCMVAGSLRAYLPWIFLPPTTTIRCYFLWILLTPAAGLSGISLQMLYVMLMFIFGHAHFTPGYTAICLVATVSVKIIEWLNSITFRTTLEPLW